MGKRGDRIENSQRCGCTDHQLGQSLRHPKGLWRIQRWLGVSWRQDRARGNTERGH